MGGPVVHCDPVAAASAQPDPAFSETVVHEADGSVWLAAGKDLASFSAAGQRLLLDVPVDGLLRVVADGEGGAWAATAKGLRRVNASGATVASLPLRRAWRGHGPGRRSR